MGLLEQLLAAKRGAGGPDPQQGPGMMAPPDITQEQIQQMGGSAMQPMPGAAPIGPPSMSPEEAMQLLGGQGGQGGQTEAPAPQQVDPAMIQSLLEQLQRSGRPPAPRPTKPQPLWGKR